MRLTEGIRVIDIHCHILPGVDDGAENPECSLDMARLAWDSGTEQIVATPHCCRPDGEFPNFWGAGLQRALQDLRELLREAQCPLRILPGMEVFSTPGLESQLARGELMPLAGSRYLLLEFYFDERGETMNRQLRLVRRSGLIPVVAHPERYEAVQRRPDLAADWFEAGYEIQVNKGSVLGRLGREARRTAWWLLERGLAHVAASDAHSAGIRTPDLEALRSVLARELPWGYVQLLLEENPRRIVEDRDLVPAEPR